MSAWCRAAARLRRDEDGSIVMSLLAAMIATTLMAMLTATVVANHRAANRDRDYTLAIQAADAGVQEAYYRFSISRFPPDRLPATGVATGSVAGGAATYEWYADRVGTSREITVYSTGRQGGAERSIVATLLENRRFFASAFATVSASFANNNVSDSYSSTAPFWPRPGRLGIVGSNGPVNTGGSSTVLDGVQLWNHPGPVPSASCSGNGKIGLAPLEEICSAYAATNPVNDTPYLEAIAEPRPVPSLAELRYDGCGAGPYPNATWSNAAPTGGGTDGDLWVRTGTSDVWRRTGGSWVLTAGALTTTNGSLPHPWTGATQPNLTAEPVGTAGTPSYRPGYYCFNNVTFVSDTVLPPVATDADPVVFYVSGTARISNSGVVVNCAGCSARTGAPPVAAAFQLYLTASGTMEQSSQTKFGGTIYGPESTCGNSGSAQAEIYGTMLCATIGNVGGWSFHYDEALELIGNSTFEITRWQEP